MQNVKKYLTIDYGTILSDSWTVHACCRVVKTFDILKYPGMQLYTDTKTILE